MTADLVVIDAINFTEAANEILFLLFSSREEVY